MLHKINGLRWLSLNYEMEFIFAGVGRNMLKIELKMVVITRESCEDGP